MPSLQLLQKHQDRRRFVRQLKTDDHLDYWSDEVLEEISGIPDILNEKLADSRVAAVLARVKGRHDKRLNSVT
jgi:hypothetical protein